MAAPTLCRMSGTFLLPTGRPDWRMPIDIIQFEGPTIIDGNWIGSHTRHFTDDDGYVEIDLVQGLNYRVRIGQRPEIYFRITVPEETDVLLFDYLVPYLKDIEFEETSINLAVGEEAEVVVLLVCSNGETVEARSHQVELLSADPLIASVNGLTVTGVANGTTTISIDSVIDDQLPDIPVDMLEDPYIVRPTPTYVIGPLLTVTVP